MEIAKGYLKHEREILDAVISARNAAAQGVSRAEGKLAGVSGSAQKTRIINAITACIMHDGKATIKGQELLRAVAACLDCPIPLPGLIL